MDEGDISAANTGFWEKVSVARIRRALAEGDGPLRCEDCGEEIPAARRAVVPGCRFCVGCQAEREV